MASTYSPLLRLELMTTGEKDGQWGTITNTNLSTILEQAVAGTTTVSITGAGASITLTSNNGATDQARAAILLITGTNASPVSIIAPASSKSYFVKNSSDQPITIKTSVSTGVTVAAGASRFVFYDTSTSDFILGPSSNVTGTVTSVAIDPQSTGLTFTGGPVTTSGTFLVGGTLAIANGGTGSATQDGAINNLLPSQASQAGKYLTTNGANISWSDVLAGATATANSFYPDTDNFSTLGTSGNRWSVVYAATGTINTSDARQKTAVQDSDLGLEFVNSLRPVSFKWVKDSEGPDNYGLLAQEVEQTLQGKSFGGHVYDQESDTHGIKYDQFIAPLIKAVQELSAEVERLKEQINKGQA